MHSVDGPKSAWARSIRLKGYPPLSEMTRHRHDEASLCLVVSGRYEESTRGRSTVHGEGHLLFCAADEPHSQRFSRQGAVKILFQPSTAALDFLSARMALEPGRHQASPRLAALARELSAELKMRDDCAAMIVDGLILELLGLFGRASSAHGRPPPWLDVVRDYLHDNLAKTPALNHVASQVGHHPTHVAREFRRVFGMTMGSYLRELRVRQAEKLLGNGTQSLAEIAVHCGFCDQAHMSRVFRGLRGITPARYRAATR